MKIVSITMVKNEVDIIESFVRYHLNVVDEMIILDNCSSDETPLIINKLIDENLPIVLLNDLNGNYVQSFKMNLLLDKAFNEHDADIVCVLDADEFLISTNNIPPRDILKNLDLNKYYLAKWMTYVPTENDSFNFFIPKRITHIRDENLESFYKVIVTKEVYNNFSPKLEMGNHDLIFPNGENPRKNMDSGLRIAHFPIRSIEQCMSKILVGWPNLISINTENESWGWHWKNIFEKIKSNNDITIDDLENFAKYYDLKDFEEEIEIINQPINLDFCKDIRIKNYFHYNYLRNILDSYEESSKQLMLFKRIFKGNEFSRLNNDYEIIKNSKLFDEEWYRDTYCLEDDINPIVHYLITWKEDMNDPASFFSTEFYLKTHWDVAHAGMNPFVHYIRYGKKENRKIASSKSNSIGISIIIPVYNVESYLNQCLDSVLSQDFDDFEVICVNDGSTDNSLSILKNYAKIDSRVKVISKSNKGPGNARNTGLRHVKGEYVFFVDSDDFISGNCLKELYDNAVSNNSDVVLFNNQEFDGIENKFKFYGYIPKNHFADKDYENFTFSYKDVKNIVLNSYFSCASKLFKRQFLEKNNLYFPEQTVFEDVLFHVKTLLYAKSISFLPKVVYNYRITSSSSIMHNKSNSFNILGIIDDVESFLRESMFFDDFKKEFFVFKITQLNYHIGLNGSDEFFQLAKRELLSLKNFVEILPDDSKTAFNQIVNSQDLEEYHNKLLKLSIIIPVYNVEDYLNQCLDSVLSQDFDDFEVICVNDGSTDNSLSILENYAKSDSRVKVISQINGGLGNARNTGLKHANGKYIMFLDSDDYISEGSVKRIYSNAVSNNSDIVIFEFYQFDEDKGTRDEYSMLIKDVFSGADFNNFTFTYKEIKNHVLNLYFCVCFNLFKKEFIEKHNFRFQEDRAYEDVLFHVKSFLAASRISFLEEFVYHYRLSNPNSIMHDSSKIFDIIKVVDSVEEFLKTSSSFKEFELEFYIFKITQLYQYIIFWHVPEYFHAVKNEFRSMKELNVFDFNKLPEYHRNQFYKVLNSNSVDEI